MPIQPYPTYQPWQGQYTTQFPTYQAPQMVQPYQQPVNGVVKVDGPNEAMNRLLMQHANQLVPGFVSEPLFDVNGRQFHVLSVEQDGRRNLETFDYTRHVEDHSEVINGVRFGSRAEFDEFAAKVKAVIGADDGVYGPVQPAAEQPVHSAADAAGAASLPRHAAGR